MTIQDLANSLGVTIINYKESVVDVDDIANKDIQGKVVEETFQLPMVQLLWQATLIADRLLQSKAYTLANISLVAKRTASRLQRGDLFKFTYTPYGISEMVCRVLDAQEENLESENILLTVIEDINYLSRNIDTTNESVLGSEGNTTKPVFQWLDPLTNVTVIESPFVVSGNEVAILPIASRVVGTEIGFQVYLSIDGGLSYSLIDTVTSFSPNGTLVAEYPDTTNTIDDKTGFEIDSTDIDIHEINSVTRGLLFTGDNFALLGNEFISFQTITPHATIDNRYIITGVFRGRLDTEVETHTIGTDFYYLSNTNTKNVISPKINPGGSVKFKLVPYSKFLGNISDATVIDLDVTGRAKKPYRPLNLKINTILNNPFYTTDNVLTWSPRLRTQGSGIGLANSVTDAAPTWEGLFEVKVYVNDILVRTTLDIDALTWTYTNAMNITDNGGLADEVTFKLSNYIIENNYKYSSGLTENTVTKE